MTSDEFLVFAGANYEKKTELVKHLFVSITVITFVLSAKGNEY